MMVLVMIVTINVLQMVKTRYIIRLLRAQSYRRLVKLPVSLNRSRSLIRNIVNMAQRLKSESGESDKKASTTYFSLFVYSTCA